MTSPSKKDYELYTNLAFHRRGAIINETIMLERIIDEILVNHFCGTTPEKTELQELIISSKRMIFENKVQVFKVILEKHNEGFLKANSNLLTDITNTVIPERNVFAHYWLVTTNDLSKWVSERKTVFVKFQNKTEHIEYDDLRFEEIMKTIGRSIRAVMPLENQGILASIQ